TQYIIWNNFGMEKQDKDINAYELTSDVLSRLDISVGMMNKYQQHHKSDKNYLANLEALSYDMLYGKQYIYGGKNPYEPTKLKMGVKDIKIDEVVKIGENYYIKGQNFTEYSKISLDGEILKTVYLGPTILALKEEVDPADVSRMKISQVEKNKEVLSTTE
ncbi:MAG: LTA synthase family protein, partial [Clostridia bacterium]